MMRIENIQPQMLLEIFSRMPIRSLCRIRCVCKQWYHLTRDPSFHRMHLARASTIQEEPLILTCKRDSLVERNDGKISVGWMTAHCTPPKTLFHLPGDCLIRHSFDGLLCIVQYECCYPTVIVSNPLTTEHLTLPLLTAVKPNSSLVWSSIFGLGFDSSIKKYKSVGVCIREMDDHGNKRYSLGAQVYTIGTSSSCSWRETMSQPTVAPNNFKNSVYAGGARQWLVNYKYSPDDLGSTLVISFDFEKEEFTTLPRPGLFSVSPDWSELVDLRGCLGVVAFQGCNIHRWKSMDYERNLWVREYSIPTAVESLFEVVGPRGEDEIFLLKFCLKDDKEDIYYKLLSYNLKTTSWRNIYDFVATDTPRVCFIPGCLGAFLHRGSLVSLSS